MPSRTDNQEIAPDGGVADENLRHGGGAHVDTARFRDHHASLASDIDGALIVSPPTLRAVTSWLFGAVISYSVLVICLGWFGRVEVVASLLPDHAVMVPSTAASLLLLGAAGLCATVKDFDPGSRSRCMVATAIVIASSAANLILIQFGSGIDAALLSGHIALHGKTQSMATSICLIAAAIKLMMALKNKTGSLSIYISIFGIVVSSTAIISYWFNSRSLDSYLFFSGMSLPTAISLLGLFSALVLMRDADRNLRYLLGPGQAGRLTRRLIPAIVGIPIAATTIADVIFRNPDIDVHLARSLITIAMISLFGIIVMLLAKNIDLTERRMLDAIRRGREDRDRAKAAEMAKADFLANMSHELRTPMAAVLGFTDLLANSQVTSDQRRQLDLIAESGTAMMALLDSILDLAKIDAGKVVVEDQTFDLHHTLNRTVRFLWAAAEQKGLDLRLVIDRNVPQSIVGDRFRTRQILTNLIGNAVKFTPGGWVRVSASVIGDDDRPLLEIAVADTGIGIPPDIQADIFGAFTQADPTITRKFGGTGLGLSICKKLADLMGGTLTFESASGKGATFFLRMPLRVANADDVPGEPALDTSSFGREVSRERILVAEDHPISRQLIKDQLESMGYNFELAEDGEAAVAKVSAAILENNPFKLILMDVQMPRCDGVDATRRLRKVGLTSSELPIIAVTAHAFEEDISACLEAGMQDHLSKPTLITELHQKIEKWLRAASSNETAVEPANAARGEKPLSVLYREMKKDLLALLKSYASAGPALTYVRIQELRNALHNLAGSAPAFGEDEVAQLCLTLEQVIPKESEAQASVKRMREFGRLLELLAEV